MKRLTLLGLILTALFFIPTGAFAKDKDHRDRRDWSRNYGDYRDYRDYRDYSKKDRDYREHQRRIIQDRLDNGYHADGTPRYRDYRR